MPNDNNLFIPRDFVYLNQDKLDSYFSQLYGGLIQNVDFSEHEQSDKNNKGNIDAELAGKLGLGAGSIKLLDLIFSQIGNIDLSAKGVLKGEISKLDRAGTNFTTRKTLQHFQYALFEESLTNSGYLIDFSKVPTHIQAGQLKEKLSVSNFIKFKASKIQISDYRNAKNLIDLFKRIVELASDFVYGELIDIKTGEEPETLKKLAIATIVSKFNSGNVTIGSGEKFNAIIEAISEVFKGDLLPIDVLLSSKYFFGKKGELTFESQLKDKYLLEERSDLSYKYGFFEDTNWTIVAQVTAIKAPKPKKMDEAFAEFSNNFKEAFSKGKEIDINTAVKSFVKELDQLTKRLGLLPLIDETSIAITPIAIYSEPNKANLF